MLCVVLAASLAGLAAPEAGAETLGCPADETVSVVTELFFGRDADGRRVVSEADWADFLAREVTPRFPDGLTVYDARGQWRDAKGRLAREATKVLLLVTPADAAAPAAPGAAVAGTSVATAGATAAASVLAGPRREDRVAAIVDAYKRRFRQKSVLVLTRSACARF
ncbi:DUF3574 domain-containing protein [Rhodoplanes sp. TEM]|uniref:DUF3574 domain-containing protein n=1 Tax=Rhodoplanes tepidamans TaxID=200616 RepID=A0ABT5JG05_RHOTP|nr:MULTISPECIES: DUF3574 domain-containing protein [Rhodoplanes]MDC7788640.1 DUF3574 domain-containing protein [Rhodoplanes tepidamans]MDC7982447.1 DUF3574 domain-containing protein [Rhodoplanes sp. TEM]MDQ0354981.1 hypothetical protein [Rhodoplanes tepidamans]